MNANTDLTVEAADQAQVIDFLSDPASHPDADNVRRIDTHAAIVFLAGSDAYKIKRAVTYPFLDFSTLEKRRLACVHEIEVNQANAPQIYNRAIAITREPDGTLMIGGNGTIVEWAVHMNRFDESRTLDRVIQDGPLQDTVVDALAHEMVRAHARAPLRDAGPWIADLRRYVDQNAEAFAHNVELFPVPRAAWLAERAKTAHRQISPLLEARGSDGHTRLCHGDAHLGNIVLIGSEPVLFDAIEFDDVIATADVLYDLAFLLMDLWERGHIHEANRTLNRYLTESRCADHYDGLAALPFFLMMRASIRAKVAASRRDFCAMPERETVTSQAKAYFSAACDFLSEKSPRLVAVGGLSGSGKSTLAARLAALVGRAPGAVVLRSDVMRKHLFGVDEKDRLPPQAYSAAASRMVYDHIGETAERILKTGHSVIADAVFAGRKQRDAIADIGRRVPFTGLWLDAPVDVLKARVDARINDASDADEAVVELQTAIDVGEMSWPRIDGSGTPERVLKQAENFLH